MHLHSGHLGSSSIGDLLNAEVSKFLLQIFELLGQVSLGLGAKLMCLDFDLLCVDSWLDVVTTVGWMDGWIGVVKTYHF
jgi:hypothetical protein